MLVGFIELASGIVLGDEGVPVFWTFGDQETDDLGDGGTLDFAALSAIGQKGIREDTSQSFSFIIAWTSFQKALDVVVEESWVGQNGVDVDAVVFGGVGVFSYHEGQEGEEDDEFHFCC